MRGSKTLFENKTLQHVTNKAKPVPGRNIELIERRNKVLMYRYCFYNLNTHTRYDVIIEKLSEEFFLTRRTIIDILTKKIDEVLMIKKEKPSSRKLKEFFPMFDWSVTALNN